MKTIVLLCALLGLPLAVPAAQDAAALQARAQGLHQSLAQNPFGRPLHLESSEHAGRLKGDIYARIEQPFAVVGPALLGMDRWCDILILHLNVKHCRAVPAASGDTLSVSIGRKFDQPLADAYLFQFGYAVAATGPDYLRVALSAAAGPLGTSDYRIELEVMALGTGQTFLHLSYAYAQGGAARWATQVYLRTVGRTKVGFSIVGRQADGQPVYIGSTRGVVERNAMRCYLAIEAYLASLSAPAAEQLEQRLHGWHAGVERYAVQLHEMDLGEYLTMKRLEVRRQQAPGPVAAAVGAAHGRD